MKLNEDKPNFLDRGTLIAFALIMLVWVGWSKFMEIKYPPAKVENPTALVTSGSPAPAANPSAEPVAHIAPVANQPVVSSVEKFLEYENDNFSFRISSKGMGLKDITIKKFQTRSDQPVVLGKVNGAYPFATNFVEPSVAVDFTLEKTASDTFVGRANVGGVVIEKVMKVLPTAYAIDTNIKVTGQMEGFKGLVTVLSDPMEPAQSGGFLSGAPSEFQEWFLQHDGSKTHNAIHPKDGLSLSQVNVAIAALSSHYFTLAIADRSDLLPKFDSQIAPNAATVSGRLVYQPPSRTDVLNVRYVAFAGPKSFELLGNVNENLSHTVDYGMFGFLGKYILWLLKWLFSVIGNWGWAIVVLTIIVRMIVLPFNAYAYKSMKAMQKIQPEMARIKERYKDKPAEARLQMNQEIMQLMKSNKASPVGGCLPTLLQLPVFFALYQVLGQSIELYRAPYMLWIKDLSDKDHFFVLPILMGATMYLQQKMTPTAMDPQQAKVLQWMPVIFSVFMLTLPSGLTLYIFVSTLFGIIQQYFFMRDKSTAQSRIKEAKA